MELIDRDEAVARMRAYHERLQACDAGASAHLDAFEDPPPGVGAHEIDRDMRLRRVNAEELRMLGYSLDQMLGHPVTEFIVMQEAAARAIDQKLMGTRELKPFLRTFRRADGSAVSMLLMDRLLSDAREEAAGIRTVMTEAHFAG